MTDPTSMWEQAQARQAHLLREAEVDRLLTEAGVAHSSLQARVLHRLGAFLISCGQRLGSTSPESTESGSRAEAASSALALADQPTDWRILADGTLVALTPGMPIAPEPGAPVSVVVRVERAPEGRVSVLCWNAERDGEQGEATMRRMALFYMTQELVPVQ